MHAFIVLSALIAGAVGGYPGGSSDGENVVDNTAYGYGFSDGLKRHQEQLQAHGYAYAYTTGNANSNVQAQSSLVFDNDRNQGYQFQPSIQAVHQNSMAGFRFPSGFPGSVAEDDGNYGHGGGGNYGGGGGAYGFSGVPFSGGAVATGSIGPDGGFQGAAVYPENPKAPNVFTRFGGGGEDQPSGDGKFYGVSVSSRSSSSDINGRKSLLHEAETSINDNGKITTYKVKNP